MIAMNFDYRAELLDSQDNLITVKTSSSYLWPGEKRFLIESAVVAPNLKTVQSRVIKTDWKKISTSLARPTFPMDIELMGPPHPSRMGFYEVDATLNNENLRDYQFIDVNVLLADQLGNVIAANKTRLSGVKSLEKRLFEIIWFSPFKGTPAKVDFQTSVDPKQLGL